VLNVFENIELPLLLQHNADSKARSVRVMALIEEVGLADRINNKPSELSGGQRQRVAIARALVTGPVMVLADEPTANLDSATGGKVLDLMRKINSRDGTTFIFSTHDQRIMDYAHRIVQMHDGQIIDGGPKAAPV
jgi:putative ABC transport system ATP-binding protein